MDERRTLIINGQSTQVTTVRVNGRPYVDLEALAKAFKGSLSFSGNNIALSAPPHPGFSREFLTAGIEQMSILREWHTALATAIQTGIPLSDTLLAPYRAHASTNLHLAFVAASTFSDQRAYQLLSNEFQNMAKLSDKYVKRRANMSYISPNELETDDLNRRIIACGRSLGAMAASGQFVDDGSCN